MIMQLYENIVVIVIIIDKLNDRLINLYLLNTLKYIN